MPIEFIKKDYDNNILAGTTLRFSKVNNVDMNNLANIKPDDIKNNSFNSSELYRICKSINIYEVSIYDLLNIIIDKSIMYF